ncbi:MAG: hypothetical protein JWO14_1243 [Solirubrobacterales bacterium]|nr:hypothetical protein [Solirubrobacterales bacterium]
MSERRYYDEYDEATTERCERALITLIGDLGPWGDRIYLAGGLAPRYLVGRLPEDARAHVGTTDVDLVIGLALGDEMPETYRTLQANLKKSGFDQGEPSFQWTREVDGVNVKIEFLCETDQVEPGRIFRPKGENAGAKFAAFNIRGAQLVREDFVERELEGERLDEGGMSKVTVRVANFLTYTVLKTLAFQDRHENKDAYDLVFTLLNAEGDPEEVGHVAHESAVAGHEQVQEALVLLEERFADIAQDGPHAYAGFLARPGDQDAAARLRQEAVATVRAFLRGFRG